MTDDIFEKMKVIADTSIQHYKTDFTEYDVRTYGRMYPGTHFLWCVRPCGTYIVGIPKTIKPKMDCNNKNWLVYQNGKERDDFQEYIKIVKENANAIVNGFHNQHFYYVVKGQSIKEITKAQALKEIA
jgi:hypothetical protein